MSKLEDIRRVLAEDPEITWEEEEIRLPYHGSRSGDYCSLGFRVAPKKPTPTVPGLRRFAAELVGQLIPIGPVSVSHCDIFLGRKEAVRMAALYFSEAAEEGYDGIDKQLVVAIYPCQMMAQDLGYRAIIEVGGYECPEPCVSARKCAFKASRRKMLGPSL
ncbi:hypothetical protein M1O54_03140 [Dehalococcoidia bacterium]|nr:hypothetical protein [Dehalococcoidia bacterium]